MKRKITKLLLTFISIFTVIGIGKVNAASYSTSDFRSWSQSQSDYSGIREVGCWIVAQSKLIYETGVDRSSSFNPDRYGEWEDAKGLIPNLTTNLNQTNGERAPEIYANEKGKGLNAINLRYF